MGNPTKKTLDTGAVGGSEARLREAPPPPRKPVVQVRAGFGESISAAVAPATGGRMPEQRPQQMKLPPTSVWGRRQATRAERMERQPPPEPPRDANVSAAAVAEHAQLLPAIGVAKEAAQPQSEPLPPCAERETEIDSILDPEDVPVVVPEAAPTAHSTEESKLEQALAPLKKQLEDMRVLLMEEKKVQEELRKENAALRKELLRLMAQIAPTAAGTGGKKRVRRGSRGRRCAPIERFASGGC